MGPNGHLSYLRGSFYVRPLIQLPPRFLRLGPIIEQQERPLRVAARDLGRLCIYQCGGGSSDSGVAGSCVVEVEFAVEEEGACYFCYGVGGIVSVFSFI